VQEGIIFKHVMDSAIDIVVRNTEIPLGIANTRGYQDTSTKHNSIETKVSDEKKVQKNVNRAVIA
jgi:hypothetical protein